MEKIMGLFGNKKKEEEQEPTPEVGTEDQLFQCRSMLQWNKDTLLKVSCK